MSYAEGNSMGRRVNATRFVVSTMGLLLALGGLDHGFFEALQGNLPCSGLFIHSIGPRQQMWLYGTEDAFTLIPNYLITGIVAIGLSVAIAVWSLFGMNRKDGSSVFLLLSVLLLLTGGGVAQSVYFVLAWLLSTRIGRPVAWIGRGLPVTIIANVGSFWPWFLGGFALLSLFALEIAIVGYVPGVSDPLQIQFTCWRLLGLGLGSLLLAIACGFVYDADRPTDSRPGNRKH